VSAAWLHRSSRSAGFYLAAFAVTEAVTVGRPRAGLVLHAALLWTALNHVLVSDGRASRQARAILRVAPGVVMLAVLGVGTLAPGLDALTARSERAASSPRATVRAEAAGTPVDLPHRSTTTSTTTSPTTGQAPAPLVPVDPATYAVQDFRCHQAPGGGPVDYRGSITNGGDAARTLDVVIVLATGDFVHASTRVTTPTLRPGQAAVIWATFAVAGDLRYSGAACRVDRVESRIP
jgi:hypothetical protein